MRSAKYSNYLEEMKFTEQTDACSIGLGSFTLNDFSDVSTRRGANKVEEPEYNLCNTRL